MTTCSVRFEFWCREATEKLEYSHRFPSSLVSSATELRTDNYYTTAFMCALRPIAAAHGVACFSASSKHCDHCGSPVSGILHTPISWLHKVGDPYIALWVSAICTKDECAEQTHQRVQDTISKHCLATDARRDQN